MLEEIFRIRTRHEEDLPAIISLMLRVYPPDRFSASAIWKEKNLLLHMERFAPGQMVAEGPEGRIIGTSTTMRTTRAAALGPHTWMDITAQGTLDTHDPHGDVLYGVNIAVDLVWQEHGVGRALYEARIGLARALGCTAFAAGARIPGYSAHKHEMTPEAYIQAVAAGERFDPTLSKQIKIGFQVLGLLRDYAPDHETCNHAALILMELT